MKTVSLLLISIAMLSLSLGGEGEANVVINIVRGINWQN